MITTMRMTFSNNKEVGITCTNNETKNNVKSIIKPHINAIVAKKISSVVDLLKLFCELILICYFKQVIECILLF